MSIEAMKQALEALETATHQWEKEDAITTLRQAIEQAEKNQFNPDWDAMAVMVEEQQRMAKRIEELEQAEKQEHQINQLEKFKNHVLANADALGVVLDAPAAPVQEPITTIEDLEQEIYENTRRFVSHDVMEWMLKRYYTTPQPQRECEGCDYEKKRWVGLTPADFDWLEQVFANKVSNNFVFADIVCVISVKLKERNS